MLVSYDLTKLTKSLFSYFSSIKFICLKALPLIIVLFSLLLIGQTAAYASDYYCSPTGSGTTCSTGSRCTLATGLTKLTSGSTDTLYLGDGTYNSSITVPVSGDATHYLTIKAENDGMATINNTASYRALSIISKSYINVEGIIFRGSGADPGSHVVYIVGSSYINLKRVSSYDANTSATNASLFLVTECNHVLLEDCAAAGYGRLLYNMYLNTYVTLRRSWGRYTNSRCHRLRHDVLSY